MQKLLYLAQGFSYAFYDCELFSDEIEAWVHGPVVPSVYHEYSTLKYNPIAINYELPKFDEKILEF